MVNIREGVQEERAKLEEAISAMQGLYDEKMAEVEKCLIDYEGEIAALKAELNELADKLIALINDRRVLAMADIGAKSADYLLRLKKENHC